MALAALAAVRAAMSTPAKTMNEPLTKESDNNQLPSYNEAYDSKDQKSTPKINFTKSYIALLLVGVCLTFDYACAFVSIQGYWAIIAPDQQYLYGFVYGIYDLGQFFCLPLFGYVSTKVGIKPMITLALILNVIGNIIYALAYFVGADPLTGATPGTPPMLIVGRLISGCGSAGLGLGVVQIAKTSPCEQRALATGYYRQSQSLARFVGPMIAIPLIFLSDNITTTTLRLFNFYTLPGWIPAGLTAIVLVCFIALFNEEEGKVSPDEENDFEQKPFKLGDAKELFSRIIPLMALSFVATFVSMALASQLFAFGTGQYHMINSANDSWKLYMGYAVGCLPIMYTWKVGMKYIPDYRWMTLGQIASIASTILLLQYAVPSSVWLFYVGTAAILAANIWFLAMCESVFTKFLTIFAEQAANKFNVLTVMLACSNALARFAGPTVSGYILTINTMSPAEISLIIGEPFNVTLAYTSTSYLQGIAAMPQSDTICSVSYPSQYFLGGCILANVNIFLPILAGVTGVCLVAYLWWQRKAMMVFKIDNNNAMSSSA